MRIVPFVVIGFFALVVMPPVLMATAHFYAISAQDKRSWYVVILDGRVSSVENVAAAHAKKYKMTVSHIWNSPEAKGYHAYISFKQLESLRADRRVASVDLRDDDSEAWFLRQAN